MTILAVIKGRNHWLETVSEGMEEEREYIFGSEGATVFEYSSIQKLYDDVYNNICDLGCFTLKEIADFEKSL